MVTSMGAIFPQVRRRGFFCVDREVCGDKGEGVRKGVICDSARDDARDRDAVGVGYDEWGEVSELDVGEDKSGMLQFARADRGQSVAV